MDFSFNNGTGIPQGLLGDGKASGGPEASERTCWRRTGNPGRTWDFQGRARILSGSLCRSQPVEFKTFLGRKRRAQQLEATVDRPEAFTRGIELGRRV